MVLPSEQRPAVGHLTIVPQLVVTMILRFVLPSTPSRALSKLLSVLLLCLLGRGHFAQAERREGTTPAFAIETSVQANSQSPPAKHLTIFTASRIYDYSSLPPEQVSWWDREKAAFTLINLARGTRTTVGGEDLVRFAALERRRALESPDPLIRFAADPHFAVAWNTQTERLVLQSDWWDYEVQTERAPTDEIEVSYFEFADWFTRLNALFRPIPPGVRLALNRELSERHLLPKQVVVRLKQDGQVIATQRSTHVLSRQLSAKQQALLSDWHTRHRKSLPVGIDAYRKALRPRH